MTRALLASIRDRRVFGQRRAAVRIAPFLLAYILAFAMFPVGDARYGWELAVAALLAAAVVAAVGLLPWRRLPAAAALAPLALYIGSVAALREAHGGSASGYAPLMIVAAVWVAMFGAAWMAAVVVGVIGVALGLPPLLAGAPLYPEGELRRALLMTLVAALVAAVIQALVRALVAEFERRERSEQQLNRLRATEIHDDIVQSLAVAQIGLSVHDRAAVDSALANALRSAQDLVADLFTGSGRRTEPGQLRRRTMPPPRAEANGAPDEASATTPAPLGR